MPVFLHKNIKHNNIINKEIITPDNHHVEGEKKYHIIAIEKTVTTIKSRMFFILMAQRDNILEYINDKIYQNTIHDAWKTT